MILKAENISKTYFKSGNKLEILKNVNLEIGRGQVKVLIGPSGSGKSSLLNILGTLDSEYSGSLFIDGTKITKSSNFPKIRNSKIGYIFQFHHLLPEFTILENILIPQIIANKNQNFAKKESLKMLKLLGLVNRQNHYPSEISGGEKQRVAAIRAVSNNPSIVLADEPTGNLDIANSKKMLKLVLKLKEMYNQSFIIATHDEQILEIADSVLYLENGMIIED